MQMHMVRCTAYTYLGNAKYGHINHVINISMFCRTRYAVVSVLLTAAPPPSLLQTAPVRRSTLQQSLQTVQQLLAGQPPAGSWQPAGRAAVRGHGARRPPAAAEPAAAAAGGSRHALRPAGSHREAAAAQRQQVSGGAPAGVASGQRIRLNGMMRRSALRLKLPSSMMCNSSAPLVCWGLMALWRFGALVIFRPSFGLP